MNEQDKQIMVQIQLDNLSKLLDAEIKHIIGVDHSGKTYRKIEITYEDKSL